ncbi:PREDICTED: U6 snRNA-associated Sm-like protein LSm8 isoform X2 [Diuraphis noxia]|uniref:U6 snRNA-associated Sm-like protein LSm8 isoform X2 n=1 Tax=Diuraphis noxia TaxID=143948 RepID=UPI000763AD4F|nr:PREDICTED: U6 snRNA-associated Sm-like protein LSm8 isoform X2 [Diuraphis noxia]
MSSGLESYVNHTVSIITSDGRNFVVNILLLNKYYIDDSHERVYSPNQGVEQIILGLHLIRGDNVAIIGEVDETMDSSIDLSAIRAEPIGSVVF